MLVFSTRLPIKDEVTQRDCLKIFIDWITKSPHYNIDSLDIDSMLNQNFEYSKGNLNVSVKYFNNSNIELSAYRLENIEPDATWISDCIYKVENGKKSLLVQLNCTVTDFNQIKFKIQKPHFIRNYIEKGYCRDDNQLPVTDSELLVNDSCIDICADIVNNKYSYSMPIVYISCTREGKNYINPQITAKRLGGMAHVIYEDSYSTSLKMKEATNGKNVYVGYVGVYFPDSNYCKKFNIANYDNSSNKLLYAIYDYIRISLINRLDSSQYNWNQIKLMQSYAELNKSDSDNKDLNDLISAYDDENKELQNKVKSLQDSLENSQSEAAYLRSSIDTIKKSSSCSDSSFNLGKEKELYENEFKDLIYSIFSLVCDKYHKESRPHDIIESFLNSYTPSGTSEKLIKEIKQVFSSGERLNKASKRKLVSLGFIFKEHGDHYKIYYKDPRYMFTVSKTPSDGRGKKNLLATITRTLDINIKN